MKRSVTTSPRTRVYLHANVCDIRTGSTGDAVKALDIRTLEGRRHETRATDYVLATGGIENARLLLASKGCQYNVIEEKDMMPKKSCAVALVLSLGLSVTGCAILSSERVHDARATDADKLMRNTMEAHHLPSLSVAVSVKGKTVYQKALGLADVESARKASPETVYAQGSVTKALTAVAVLMLTEEGLVDLDAPVQRYCPSFPKNQDKITLRQLLAHTAGIRHYDYSRFQEDYMNDVTYESIQNALVKFKDDPLVADPGEEYHYSSWGYVVVACAMEGASGESYDEFIMNHILKPAGMQHRLIDKPELKLDHRATGYSVQDDGSHQVTGVLNPSDRYGASGLLSTPGDLVRFANALLEGAYIDQEMLEMMWSPQTLTSGESTGHGLGWDIDHAAGTVAKGGTSYDATSYLYIVAAKQLVVAINTNRILWTEGRKSLARKLADIFSENDDPM